MRRCSEARREAGKDAYVRKADGQRSRGGQGGARRGAIAQPIVQIGTQHRSEPYQIAAKECGPARRARPR